MAPSLVVSCLSQKGGVGKSTLARLVATTYAHQDWRVKIADLNVRQKTSVDWAAMRMGLQIKPIIAAEPIEEPKIALKQDWDLLVFDGKPDSDRSSLEVAKASHMVVIPCGTAIDDIAPQIRFANELIRNGIRKDKIIFILNQTTDSASQIDGARQTIIERGGFTVAKQHLPHRAAFQNAQNAGRSVLETEYKTLNNLANEVAVEIVDRANQLLGVSA